MIKHTSKSVFIRESSSSVIQTYYEPALDYNDYTICNPQNKNGDGLFNDLLNFLTNPNSTETKQETTGIKKNEEYRVYPIPTSDVLTIEYYFAGEEDAEMILYDLLGREVIKTMLSNSNTTVSIPTGNLMQGIYTYKIKVGVNIYTNKIVKQ
jgi:hypothetical protein